MVFPVPGFPVMRSNVSSSLSGLVAGHFGLSEKGAEHSD